MADRDGDGSAANGSGLAGERAALLDLQARMIADAGRATLRAMGALARRQADALDRVAAELEAFAAGRNGAGGPGSPLAMPELCLRLFTQALSAQASAAREDAAVAQAVAFAWLVRDGAPGMAGDAEPPA